MEYTAEQYRDIIFNTKKVIKFTLVNKDTGKRMEYTSVPAKENGLNHIKYVLPMGQSMVTRRTPFGVTHSDSIYLGTVFGKMRFSASPKSLIEEPLPFKVMGWFVDVLNTGELPKNLGIEFFWEVPSDVLEEAGVAPKEEDRKKAIKAQAKYARAMHRRNIRKFY